MSAPHARRMLVESLGVCLTDFSCRAQVHPDGEEEHNLTYSIVFVRRGAFGRVQGRQRVVADANHVLFFSPEQPYRIFHPAPGGDDCTILALPAELAREAVARHAPREAERPGTPFRIGHALSTRHALRLHYELLALAARGTPSFALEDTLAELADEALRSACQQHGLASGDGTRREPGRVARHHREVAEEVKRLLSMRLDRAPGLGELARRLGCSPFHLSRTFRRAAGMSLRAYLGQLRTRTAADRLARGEDDLTRLALELGYADHAHFTRAFRGAWGMPPSAFRRAFGRAVPLTRQGPPHAAHGQRGEPGSA